MAEFQSFFQTYGLWLYPALFAYCALKSGALPLFAGIAAANGLLDVHWVAISTLAGGILGDEFRFRMARRYGQRIMMGRPRLAAALGQAQRLMERYGVLYLFLYRYPKGMRTIGAFPVGLTEMPWHRFTLLNIASASLWALLLVGGGYGLGEMIGPLAERNFRLVSAMLLLPLVAWGIFAFVSNRRSGSRTGTAR
ncbi:MAG: VTT domain-containing protein [Microcystis sp. LE19-4.1E]|jgi:membrane-associated protein|nr:VTT domain-containing protein [Microcystis sp. LE19-4.1E]